jgi:ribosomal protein L44E
VQSMKARQRPVPRPDQCRLPKRKAPTSTDCRSSMPRVQRRLQRSIYRLGSQGRFAPPRCAGQSVQGAPLAARGQVCSQPNLQLACSHCREPRHRRRLWWAHGTVSSALVGTAQGLYKAAMLNAPAPRLLSNPTLNRTANGVPHWPRCSSGSSSASRPARHTAGGRLAPR